MANDTGKNRLNESANHAPEHDHSGLGRSETIEKLEKDHAVKAAVDTIAGVEGVEDGVESIGHVAEGLGEGKEQKGGGMAASGQTGAQSVQDIREQLLKNLPSEKEMRKQIEKEIKKEIGYLHNKAMKMVKKPGEMNYFEMNNLMRKIRELKGLLLMLVKSSVEGLKSLWLRYVHGIMQ